MMFLDVGLLVLFLGVVLGAEVNLHDLTVPPVQDQLEVEVAAQSAPVTTTTETSFVSDLRDDLSHLKVILKNVSMEASLPALGKEYRMSVEFKASSTSNGGTDNLNSVLHFDKLGPQVFVRNDNKKVRSVVQTLDQTTSLNTSEID